MSHVATRMTALLAVASLVLATHPARAQTTASAPWSGIEPGSFPVAYRAIRVRDRSRTLLPDTATSRAPRERAIPVRLWYPAATADAPAGTLRFSDFLHLGSTTGAADSIDLGLAERTRSIHRYSARKYAQAGGTPLVAEDTAGIAAAAILSRTASLRTSTPAAGRHPLLLFAGGTAHSVDENVALWEHLASHGFLVAAIPTVGVEEGIEGAYLPDDALGLETVTRDLEIVLAHLLDRPDVDTSRIAAAGFSFGGAAALALAARNPRIRAVVGLDASFIAARHLPMIRAAPLFDIRRLAVPVLEFHRADTTVDLSLLDSATRSERTSIELDSLDHIDFNSYVLLYAPLLRARASRPARDSALAFKAEAYRAMVRTTRLFLEAALSERPSELAEETRRALRGEGPVWEKLPWTAVRARRSSAPSALR